MNEMLNTYKELLEKERNRLSEYTIEAERLSAEDQTTLFLIEERIHVYCDFIRDLELQIEKEAASA